MNGTSTFDYNKRREQKKRRLLEILKNEGTPSASKIYESILDHQINKKEPTDPRFQAGFFILDELEEAQPSLIIKLFENSFTLQNQVTHYPYSRNTAEFVESINSQRIPPDLLPLMDSIRPHYYDGCLIVELQDHRGLLYSNAPPQYTHRVILYPDALSIIQDVEEFCKKTRLDSTQDEIIKIEQHMLKAVSEPLCLDPSPNVLLVNNFLNYNRQKFNIKPKKETKEIEQPEQQQTMIVETPTVHNFPLLQYLGKKERVVTDIQEESFDTLVHKSINRVMNQMISKDAIKPILPKESELNRLLNNRKLRFYMNGVKTFCAFQVSQQGTGGYVGELRIGRPPDVNTNGEIIRFPLGNAHEAELAIAQLKALYEKEGSHIVDVPADDIEPPDNYTNKLQVPLMTSMNIAQLKGIPGMHPLNQLPPGVVHPSYVAAATMNPAKFATLVPNQPPIMTQTTPLDTSANKKMSHKLTSLNLST